jgi:predicted N-formylglutamate amidohydrolase
MALPRRDYLILSCEHGGNRLPPRFQRLFSPRFLATHRGHDPGALAVARDFAAATAAPLFYSTGGG